MAPADALERLSRVLVGSWQLRGPGRSRLAPDQDLYGAFKLLIEPLLRVNRYFRRSRGTEVV